MIHQRLFSIFVVLCMTLLAGCGGQIDGEIATGTDFTLTVATPVMVVAPGTAVHSPVAVAWVGCPPRDVTFEASAPTGVTPSFTVNPSASATELQVAVPKGTPNGNYTLLVRGTNQTLSHSRNVQVVVSDQAPGFSLSIAPPRLSVDSLRPATATVTLTRSGGYAEPVAISAKLPPGFSYTLSGPAGLAAAATETRTLTLSVSGVVAGSYTLQLEARSSTLLVRQEVQVSVVDAPQILAFTASPGTIELGASSTLRAGFAGGTGAISGIGPVAPGATLTVSPTVDTTYTLTVTNSLGTSVTADAPVKVGPVLVTLAPASGILSVGKTLPLLATVTGAVNKGVLWSVLEAGGGGVAPSGNTAVYTAPATPGTYHVRAASQADPGKFAECTVTVVAPPTATLAVSPLSISPGLSATLTPTFSGGTAVLSPALGPLVSGTGISTGPLFTDTTYTLTVTNAAGDKAVATATVAVIAIPIATITAPAYATFGQAGYGASVPVQPGSTYAWTVGNGTLTSAATGPSITFTAGSSGITSLQCVVTNSLSLSTTGTANVTLVAPPSISGFFATGAVTTGGPLLFKEPTTLTATFAGGTGTVDQGIGAVTSGVATSSFPAKPSGTTNYTLRVTNLAGTSATSVLALGVQTVVVTVTPTVAASTYYFTKRVKKNLDQAPSFGNFLVSVTGSYPDQIASGFTYRPNWSTDCPGSTVNPEDGYVSFTAGSYGTFTLTFASLGDPSKKVDLPITVVPLPSLSLSMAFSGGVWTVTGTFSGGSPAAIFDNTTPISQNTSGTGLTLPFPTGALVSGASSPLVFNAGAPPFSQQAFILAAVNQAGNYAYATTSRLTLGAITSGIAGPMAATTPNYASLNNVSVTVNNPVGTGPVSSGVDWTVDETDGGSFQNPVNASPTFSIGYVAPTLPGAKPVPFALPGAFTVRATSQADPNITTTLSVQVYPLFVWPANQTVGQGNTLILRHAVLGAPSAVNWSIPTSPLGSVSANGVYTAPNGGATPITGTDQVLVSLAAFPTVAVKVPINVVGSIPAHNSFQALTGAKLTDARYGHTLTSLGSLIGDWVLLAGGDDPGAPPSTTPLQAWWYQPSTDAFTALGGSPMLDMQKFHTATLLPDGKVLLAGGYDGFGKPMNCAELFDPVSFKFRDAVGMLTVPRARHTATLLPNGKVLLAGGETAAGVATDSAELYDPLSETFSPVANAMSSPRTHHAAERLLVGGQVLVAGGSRDGSTTHAAMNGTADLYDPATNAFTPTIPLPGGARLMNAVSDVGPGGDAHLAGGVVSTGSPAASDRFFRFNASGPSWAMQTSPALFTGRNLPLGMILPDRLFLVLGGYSDLLTTKSMSLDLFNITTLDYTGAGAATGVPFSGFPSPTPPSVQGDSGRMVLLANGKVLMAGSGTSDKAVRTP